MRKTVKAQERQRVFQRICGHPYTFRFERWPNEKGLKDILARKCGICSVNSTGEKFLPLVYPFEVVFEKPDVPYVTLHTLPIIELDLPYVRGKYGERIMRDILFTGTASWKKGHYV